MMKKNYHLVIMAGGVGSRFWPLSSEELPKQFLDVLGVGRTLIQLTADRFAELVPAENIWVVTSAKYAELVYQQLPDVPRENVLLEPCRRNTAPCICYASWCIKKKNPRATVVVTPSDHIVMDNARFAESISDAIDFASETDAIVTLGMKPTRPETGYGYIKADLSFASSRKKNVYRVDAFKEKPTLEIAEQYVQDSSFFWNAGIFVWTVSTIVNAFRVYQPEISRIFENLMPVYGTAEERAAIDKFFPECESISVDYAILEKAEEIFVYPADFGWSDLGTWGSLQENLPRDNYGNAVVGEDVTLYESRNCIVHAEGLKKVVLQGLDGFVVAERDGVLLVCQLAEEQRIKLFH
ncbi:MAG: mannose-1-phosphate guanylyltransferase [Alloprevotella sp.]|nr:mannose-1-phosphate guanylyltransferase [Alloprevotella sp.]MBR1652771.1 mannose-1-phosphate guanylyltransferase [Alloprevotella sp.]